MIAVKHEGKIVGVFEDRQHADRYVEGLGAQQIRVVGYVEHYEVESVSGSEIAQWVTETFRKGVAR